VSPAADRPRRAAAPRVDRLAIAVDADVGRLPLGRPVVSDLARFVLRAERVRDAMLSITFVSARRSARLHREHLGVAGPTDIITFALGESGPVAAVGDIYICAEVVRAHARTYGVPVRTELQRVVVHGVLHVLGHTHPEGEGRERSTMWRRQERLLARFLQHEGP